MTQPQLFSVSLVPSDVVYTPENVARDIVDFFKPTGRILEPACGEGVFLKYLPPCTKWCEIEKGRDFFAENRNFDWIVGNPPYSIFLEWLEHTFTLANDVVYLVPTNKVFQSFRVMDLIDKYGGIRAIRNYGGGGVSVCRLGFRLRRSISSAIIAAIHELIL